MKFKFEISDEVQLELSREEGRVIGRAEYGHLPPSYYVRYIDGNGCQIEAWFDGSALIPNARLQA